MINGQMVACAHTGKRGEKLFERQNSDTDGRSSPNLTSGKRLYNPDNVSGATTVATCASSCLSNRDHVIVPNNAYAFYKSDTPSYQELPRPVTKRVWVWSRP
jgi:hypothetical protein